MTIDVSHVRSEFPALSSDAIFFDNPGGTQVSRRVVERVKDYLLDTNANHGGAFATSAASDAIVDQAREAMAFFLNAAHADEIVFGPNMTTLTLSLSRSLARELQAGDEIVVTRLDHDANITPWTLIAQDRGCTVRWVDFDVEDCTLRMDQMEDFINERTRLVAVGYASNAVGTINPIQRIVQMAHEAGALCYVDAVQYAPHGLIDVQALDCDFLVVSGYKFFGPHVGVLYSKKEHLTRLRPYKVRPAPDKPPGNFETGTQNFEGIAGLLGALEYLAWLGKTFGAEHAERFNGIRPEMRLHLMQAMSALRAQEMELSRALIQTLSAIRGLRVYGITDLDKLDHRVPTVSFRMDDRAPRQIAEELARGGIYVWDGNYYALAVTERLGVEDQGGMVRVGLVHYNTHDEIERLGDALQAL
ncbi:MAG TPA: cysteine desulfurase-like protein [Anaerolineae bacterium]|nr:cysteine desulfurase-like protein [Anaerolineae bacterium]